jgi:hypothetical protein
MKWRVEATLVVGLLFTGWGCLDPEPVVVERNDMATASAECLKCLSTPDTPGPGCADEVAACRAAPICSIGYDCQFQRGCVGGSTKTFNACLPGCTVAAGFSSPDTSTDDPGRIAGLHIYQCLTRGACSAVCFTDVSDGGAPPDATGDAAPPACTNPSDQAIASNSAATGMAANDCGLMCFGMDPDCNTSCMIMKTGFSRLCAQCWADSIACASEHCLAPCVKGRDDPDCQACTAQFCTPAFHACSGL